MARSRSTSSSVNDRGSRVRTFSAPSSVPSRVVIGTARIDWSTAQWLLMLHISAAFFFVGGSVAAGILNVLAIRSERPSETAYLLRLIRFTLPAIGIGSIGALVFGIWLWHEQGYSLGAAWIWI